MNGVFGYPSPQARTSGELVGVANMLSEYMAERFTENVLLREENKLLRGAIEAADARLLAASKRVDIYGGCDTPHDMADEIESLRAELADRKQNADVEALKAEIESLQFKLQACNLIAGDVPEVQRRCKLILDVFRGDKAE